MCFPGRRSRALHWWTPQGRARKCRGFQRVPPHGVAVPHFWRSIEFHSRRARVYRGMPNDLWVPAWVIRYIELQLQRVRPNHGMSNDHWLPPRAVHFSGIQLRPASHPHPRAAWWSAKDPCRVKSWCLWAVSCSARAQLLPWQGAMASTGADSPFCHRRRAKRSRRAKTSRRPMWWTTPLRCPNQILRSRTRRLLLVVKRRSW